MPAPKRGSASHDPQAKVRKTDEDGKAATSISTPAADTKSHKTGNSQKRTVTPRAKKKQPTERKEKKKTAMSSSQSSKQKSPQSESSKTTSGPPVKKAKLLKATSASCGAASSKKASSKASVKRPATLTRTESTESDDLSSEGSKTDLFKGRGDGNKTRCIRKYSNGVRGKRKALGISPDLQNTSRGTEELPPDSIQMDHNYGRLSSLPSLRSEHEGEKSDSKEFTDSIPEPLNQNYGRHETTESSKGLLDSVSEHMKLDIKSHDKVEVIQQKEPTESVHETDRQNMADESPAFSKKTSDSAIRDVKPVGKFKSESETNEREKVTESVGRTGCFRDGNTKTQQSSKVTSDLGPQVESPGKTLEGNEFESRGVPPSSSISEQQKDLITEHQASLQEAVTASEEMLPVSNPEDKVETTGLPSNPEYQRDIEEKTQVPSEVKSNSQEIMLSKISQKVSDTTTNSCDGFNLVVGISENKVEKEERHKVTSVSPETITGPGCSEQVQQSQGPQMVKGETSFCPDSGEEREQKFIIKSVTVPESQKDLDKQTRVTSEERSDPIRQEEIQKQGGGMDTSDSVTSIPGPEAVVHSHENQEVCDNTTAISNEVQNGLSVVHSVMKEHERKGVMDTDSVTVIQREENVVTGSTEVISDAFPDLETGGQGNHEIKESPAFIPNEQVKMLIDSNGSQGGINGRKEVISVCGQQGKTDLYQASIEEIPDSIPVHTKSINQSQHELHDIPIVYEAISSPESNVDIEEKYDTVPVADPKRNITLQGEENSTAKSTNEVNSPVCDSEGLDEASNSNGVVCVPDSQTDVYVAAQPISMSESSVPVQMEENTVMEVAKQVTVISSSDEINVPVSNLANIGKMEDSNGVTESIIGPEPSEELQEGQVHQERRVHQEVEDSAVSTVAEAPDSTSEDVVILELTSVQAEETQINIITQAAATSGLTTSVSEKINPDSTLASEHVESVLDLDNSLDSLACEVEVPLCQEGDEAKEVTVTNPSEESKKDLEDKPRADIPPPPIVAEDLQVIQDSVHCKQPSSDLQNVNNTEIVTTNSFDYKALEVPKEGCDVGGKETSEATLDHLGPHIVEDIEIGHCIVEVVGENDEEVDSDSEIILQPQDMPKTVPLVVAEEKDNEVKEETVDTQEKAQANSEQNKNVMADDAKKVQGMAASSIKREMNPQARTKARLAALAEQKAAASKTVNRQQLNLLALCEEIAEDIATDSMLLKRIEEEKLAAAAKAEASKKVCPPVTTQDADIVDVPTPAGPEECSSPVSEASTAKPPSDDTIETKSTPEPPKRRFFISQVTVPLKVHEKKKLTRYQRLRQVELQREKMSWTRVKKLKSDQANQMFLSDIDINSPLSISTLGSPSLVATPPPVATSPPLLTSPSTPKTPVPDAASASISTTPKVEAAKAVTPKTEPTKAEHTKAEPTTTESTKAESTKTKSTKAESTKVAAAKLTPAAVPTPKVTRSAAKRILPASPPPMPNGLTGKKPKPTVEYKPYRPRPKYSIDDFELDDDPAPAAKPVPQSRPAPQTRPNLQSKPVVPSKPMVSFQHTAQAKPTGPATPALSVSGQPKTTVSATGQSKPVASATPPLKPAVGATPQSKSTVTIAAQSKPIVATKAQLRPAVTTTPSVTLQSKPTGSAVSQSKPTGTTKPAGTTTVQPKAAEPAAVQLKTAVLTTSETKPAVPKSSDPVSSSPSQVPASCHPPEESLKDSNKTLKHEEKPAVAEINPSSLENKKEPVETNEKTTTDPPCEHRAVKPQGNVTPLSETCLQKEVKKLKEADKDGNQTIIDAGQKHFGAVACSVCGMLYSAANPEDESHHLLFHNQFISAVKYVGWKKERILGEYPDGKIILVLPDDPKYALKKVEEIREMVDNDLGFQQVEPKCPSQTKTFLFISNDKKVVGCLIAEHIQEGYRVIEDLVPEGSEGEKVMFERQRAWCCSTTPEPALCGISRIWVFSMMRRQGIASRMVECLRNNFIYGSCLSKSEIAFSDPTPDGKLFATNYFGTTQFLVYNFVSGTRSSQPKTDAV